MIFVVNCLPPGKVLHFKCMIRDGVTCHAGGEIPAPVPRHDARTFLAGTR